MKPALPPLPAAKGGHAAPLGAALALTMTLSIGQAAAQTAPASLPPYQTLRYNEDYRSLIDPSLRTDPWDSLKYIPLGADPDVYLSFGGELRERVELASPPNFGLNHTPPTSYLMHRLLLSADLHLGPSVRGFVQFGEELAAGKHTPLSPTDVDRFDLAQAFIDLRLPLPADAAHDTTLRVGRQELSLGSQRLVSVRESPNVRRSFDGATILGQVANTSFTALLLRPVQPAQGTFDDTSNLQQALWGVYTTTKWPDAPFGTGLDLYYLGFENTHAHYATASGNEVRHSIGARLFGARHGWDWDWEAIGQFGSLSHRSIVAWSVATNTGFVFADRPWTPRVGLKANVASGTTSRQGGTIGSFNALFPKLAYFNEASLLAPSNFYDVNPEITVVPLRDVTVTAGWDFLWRFSNNDAVFANPFAAIPGTATCCGAEIGNQISLDAAWQVDRHLQLSTSFVHFKAGRAIRQVGGRDVNFGQFQAAYKF
jgi:hypothetical protein